ncbi:C1 family peptidase [Hellea sp.]|nr:C1 family peptidase [Hellea sp.]
MELRKKRFYAFLLLGFLGSSNIAYSQTTGFIPPTPDEFNSFALTNTHFGKINGPPPKQDSIAQFFPNPGEQGTQYSCMGFAFAHAMITSLEAQKTRRLPEPYSAAYLYNSTKEEEPQGQCNYGVKPSVIINMLTSYGVPRASAFPFDPKRCDKINISNIIQTFPRRKLKDVERINGPGSGKDIVTRVRDAIASSKQPVVIGMPTGPNFANYRSGIYPSNFQTKDLKQILNEVIPNDAFHSMVIIGYDDTRGFKVINSHGLDWGDLGFGWIDDEVVERKNVWLWTAKLGDLVESTGVTPSVSVATSPEEKEYGAAAESTDDPESVFGAPAISYPAAGYGEKYAFGEKLASSLRGTVGHNAAGQTPKGIDYYPVSLWLQLAEKDMKKLKRVEYHWNAPSYKSPKVPKGKSETSYLIEYFGYGAVSQASIRVWLVDGTEYEIFYPFRSIWNYGSLNYNDLKPNSTIIKVDPKALSPCSVGSSRVGRGPCIAQ